MSSFLIVNGVEFPVPRCGTFNFITSTPVDSARNANAQVVGTRLGSRNQFKLDGMEWAMLDADTWYKMMQAVENFYVPVTFEHPETGATTTITMYVGDRTATPFMIDKTTKKVTKFENCKMNLIDTGK